MPRNPNPRDGLFNEVVPDVTADVTPDIIDPSNIVEDVVMETGLVDSDAGPVEDGVSDEIEKKSLTPDGNSDPEVIEEPAPIVDRVAWNEAKQNNVIQPVETDPLVEAVESIEVEPEPVNPDPEGIWSDELDEGETDDDPKEKTVALVQGAFPYGIRETLSFGMTRIEFPSPAKQRKGWNCPNWKALVRQRPTEYKRYKSLRKEDPVIEGQPTTGVNE